jgi:phenol hydroxylase P2 protein
MEERQMAQIASLTLYHNDDARPIIEAILADNPGVRVMNMPGAVKLDCEGPLVVNRASVEERMGRPWDVQEMHLVLISMAGNLDEDDDHFTVSWRH